MSDKFMKSTDLLPGLNAIVSCVQGRLTTAVLNTTAKDVKLQESMGYGRVTRTCNQGGG